jgi:hypothetical protein
MAKRRLNEKDIKELLTQYRSERRRLIFQLDRVREAIAGLKGQLGENDGEDDEAPVKRGPGRPRKNPEEKAKRPKKAGRRKKRTIKNGGYRLSDWDQMVVGAITKADRLLPKEDLKLQAMAWARKNEPLMTEPEIEVKLTRVLQKLSGKRGLLGTHRSGLRRGYHYGLKDWFFSSSGALRKQHYDKLVLNKD